MSNQADLRLSAAASFYGQPDDSSTNSQEHAAEVQCLAAGAAITVLREDVAVICST